MYPTHVFCVVIEYLHDREYVFQYFLNSLPGMVLRNQFYKIWKHEKTFINVLIQLCTYHNPFFYLETSLAHPISHTWLGIKVAELISTFSKLLQYNLKLFWHVYCLGFWIFETKIALMRSFSWTQTFLWVSTKDVLKLKLWNSFKKIIYFSGCGVFISDLKIVSINNDLIESYRLHLQGYDNKFYEWHCCMKCPQILRGKTL